MTERNTDRTATATENLRVVDFTPLVSPARIKKSLVEEGRHSRVVREARETARDILSGRDDRMLAIVGPCSIHDPASALDYARRLSALSREVADRYFIIMRVYFEKPRTTIGWKGLINDPDLDDSCDVARGIEIARRLLLDILDLGLPAATEFLDPIIPQYTADLISWAAIGARTTESQTHREMASGLSMPVGFKNGTDGSIQTALDAMKSSRAPHSFIGMDQDGATSIVRTKGNPDGHIVLRGGRNGANYHPEQIAAACEALSKAGLPPALVVDCSHANSGKDPRRQAEAWRSVIAQRAEGRREIKGAMLESHIHEGNQPLAGGLAGLRYGVSITDACLGWEATEALLRSG